MGGPMGDRLLEVLRARGVELWSQDGQIRYRAPKGALDASALDELKQRKDWVLPQLSARTAPSAPSSRPTFRRFEPRGSIPTFRHSSWQGHADATIGVDSANGSFVFSIPGAIGSETFLRILSALCRRHPTLCFVATEAEGRRGFISGPEPALDIHDLASSASSEEAEILAAQLAWRRFTFPGGSLCRAFLIRRGPEEQIFGLVIHHMICDWISRDLLMRELAQLYRTALLDLEAEPVSPGLRYKDYLLAMDEWLASDGALAAQRHWSAVLRGGEALYATFDQATDVETTEEHIRISGPLTERLRASAQALRVSLFCLLVAAQMIMLRSDSKCDVGLLMTVTSGRDDESLQEMIGYLSDRTFYRADMTGETTSHEVVQRVWSNILESSVHQFFRFDAILDRCPEAAHLAVPCFNFLPLSPGPSPTASRSDGASVVNLRAPTTITRPGQAIGGYYLVLEERSDGILGRLRHKGHPRKHFARRLIAVLETLLDTPNLSLSMIERTIAL